MGLAFTYFEPKAIEKEQAPSHFLPKSKAQVWKGKDVSLSLNKKRGKTLNHEVEVMGVAMLMVGDLSLPKIRN